ncbi:hypothetical protein HanRHA438_Chr16g0770691 [Helianthus annuus]|nr:hypothetical protein HanRHA438_Chr16g0770691 [Helianthus annuus]
MFRESFSNKWKMIGIIGSLAFDYYIYEIINGRSRSNLGYVGRPSRLKGSLGLI